MAQKKGWFTKLVSDMFSTGGQWREPDTDFLPQWRVELTLYVPFYNSLDADEKIRFERRVHIFMVNVMVTGVDVIVTTTDRLLIAASAVIPIFAFEDWHYRGLREVLLYSDRFNHDFETEGDGRRIKGMVGTGYMKGKMALSKMALHQGFRNQHDGQNTTIHEFIHLLDMEDMEIDGLPSTLLDKKYSLPWLDIMRHNILAINQGHSDIRPYGGTNPQEFFAVVGEYFFERPDLLSERHPELYAMLVRMFHQDMKLRRPDMELVTIKRNDKCPCGSGSKYKKCCAVSRA